MSTVHFINKNGHNTAEEISSTPPVGGQRAPTVVSTADLTDLIMNTVHGPRKRSIGNRGNIMMDSSRNKINSLQQPNLYFVGGRPLDNLHFADTSLLDGSQQQRKLKRLREWNENVFTRSERTYLK